VSEPDGIEIDGQAMNCLVVIFRRCAEAGIEIPPLMPLGTPEHQRAAAHYLGKVLQVYYQVERDLLDGDD
jgi:hypothetical protein